MCTQLYYDMYEDEDDDDKMLVLKAMKGFLKR